MAGDFTCTSDLPHYVLDRLFDKLTYWIKLCSFSCMFASIIFVFPSSGAEITSTFDNPDCVKLGHCDLITEIMIGEDRLIKFSGTLIRISVKFFCNVFLL